MYASSQFHLYRYHLKSGICSSLVPSPYYRLQYNYKFSPGISPLFVLQAMIVVAEEATCAAYVYTTTSVGTNDTLAYDRYFIYQWIQIGLY